MTPQEIVQHVRKLFEPTTSPGQAFDALFAMRQARVMYQEVFNAIVQEGGSLDERDAGEHAGFQQGLPMRLPPQRPTAEAPPPTFKNPVLSFGKHKGKKLLDVAACDPSWLSWLANNSSVPFWKEQARLAIFAAEAQAPVFRDTSPTGYMDPQ